MKRGLSGLVAACLVPWASAGPAIALQADVFVFTADRYYAELGDTVEVTLSIAVPDGLFAVSRVEMGFTTITGVRSQIDGFTLLPPMDGPGSSPGAPTASGVEAIVATQPHDPPAIVADGRSLLPIWTMELTVDCPLPGGWSDARVDFLTDGEAVWFYESASSTEQVRVPVARFGAPLLLFTECLADINGDGSVDFFDWLGYQSLFDRGLPYADLDADGELTVFDFLAFQNIFLRGCP